MMRGLFRLTQGSLLFRGCLHATLAAGFMGALALSVSACEGGEGSETGLEGGNDSGKPGVEEKEYCFEVTCESRDDGGRRGDDGYCSIGGCERDDDCPKGLNCENEVCALPKCVRDSDCDRGYLCNDEICQPPPCESDKDCASDQICERDRCVPAPCKDDSDCDSDFICDDDSGACIPAPCEEDSDCEDGWICEEDTCIIPACTQDSDCPAEICLPASNLP